MDWPILYKNILNIGNEKSPVGVAVMWTEREVVANLLNGLDYCVIGNLYSAAGISAMMRNIFAKPHIRYIILWGADLSRSGQTLLQFMKYGVNDNYSILGGEKGGQIEKEIPLRDIGLFRKSVNVINLRGSSPETLKTAVQKYSKKKQQAFTRPRIFPTSRKKAFTFPSEQIGFRVHGDSVAFTWLRVLNLVSRYGRIKKTRYARENELKELLNMTAVVYDEDIKNPYLPQFFPFTKKDLDTYYPQVMSAKKIPGISYTYGQRLRNNQGVDQVKEVIKLVKRRPFSKKMAMATVDVRRDWGARTVDKGDTPCLTQVLLSIQDDKLFMTAHFRSQDMVHGWPRNAFSLIKLQEHIAEQTDYEKGAFCMITHSAHIYSDDYELVERTLRDNFENELPFTASKHFEEDKRGNFTIEVTGQKRKRGRKSNKPYIKGTGNIVLRLFSPDGGLELKKWRGKKAMDVYLQLTDWDYLSLAAHAADIGAQLTRAEYAIKHGWEYSQDAGPNKM